MITKAKNKQLAATIATFFCEGESSPGLCLVAASKRIVNALTDEIFEESFITHLDSARFYALTIAHAPSSEGFIKYIIGGFDILAGKNKTMMIDGIPGDKRNDVAWVFNIRLNHYYHFNKIPQRAVYLGKVNGKYLLQITMPKNYGIVIVNGEIIRKSSPIPPGDPPIEPVQPAEAGFDVAGILSNPMVLIGGATLLFFYFMND